jgi:hypothetical protein
VPIARRLPHYLVFVLASISFLAYLTMATGARACARDMSLRARVRVRAGAREVELACVRVYVHSCMREGTRACFCRQT